MIGVKSGPSSPTATAEIDPYIALTVNWSIGRRGDALNLFVQDPDQGYVELSVDSRTGELFHFVVIDEPRRVEPRADTSSVQVHQSSVVVDRRLWPWKVTPDYTEPSNRAADLTMPLRMTSNDHSIAVRFSQSPVAEYFIAGTVRVGATARGELAVIDAAFR